MDSVPTSPSLVPSTSPPSLEIARLGRFRLAMAVLWTLVIMTLCWLPKYAVHELEDGSSWFKLPNFDKLVHACIFVGFAILWVRVSTSTRRIAWTALGGVALAVVTEIVQEFPAVGRDASFADGITDIAGLLIGLLVAPLVEPIARSVESLIIRKVGPRAAGVRESTAASSEREHCPEGDPKKERDEWR